MCWLNNFGILNVRKLAEVQVPRGRPGLLGLVGSFFCLVGFISAGIVHEVRMKLRLVAAGAVKFVVGVDKEFRVFSFEFKDCNSLLHAKNTVNLAK